MDLLVEARSLVKRYGQVKAINGVHLEVHRGRCVGILGPKGSGKTSLLKMIHCGALVSAGELFVFGLNVKKNDKKIRAQLGIVPQELDFDPELCVFDNLLLFARYHGLPKGAAKVKARMVLRTLNLAEHESSFIDGLKPIVKKLLMLARALLNDPKLLILDEPTACLPPPESLRFWRIVQGLKADGMTVLLATDKVDEVEFLVDDLVIMDKGKVLVTGVPHEMVTDRIGHEVVEFAVHGDDLEYYLRKVKERYAYQVLNSRIRLFVDDGQDSRAALDLISSENIVVRRASLEDVFLRLSGYELRRTVVQ